MVMEDSYIKDVGEYYPVDEMETYVRMAYYDLDTLVGIWVEEILYPDQFYMDQKEEVRGVFGELIDELEREQERWPEETDFDRLEKVFARLNGQGVVCTHHVGLEDWMRPGVDSLEYLSLLDIEKVVGCCYYTFVDMMSAIESDSLSLQYDSMNPCCDNEKMVAVGRLIRAALETEGFEVEWNGNPEASIIIEDFDWQRW